MANVRRERDDDDRYARGQERGFVRGRDERDDGRSFGGQRDFGERAFGGFIHERGWEERGRERDSDWRGSSRSREDDRLYASGGLPQRVKEFIGKGPKGFTRSDERIREEIHEQLSSGYLDASDIEVTVKNGEVTLTGTVRSKSDRRIAEDVIEDIVGVKDVDNRLKLKREGQEAGSEGDRSQRRQGQTATPTSGETHKRT